MHNRQPITFKLLFQSLSDYDLWSLYLLGLTFQLPATPEGQYLTLSLKGLGFNTLQSNLLSIPYTVFHIITMLALTYTAEYVKNLTLMGIIGQIWILPCLIWFNVANTQTASRWTVYAVTTVLLSYPNAACYNMFCQAGGIIASNIYRKDDAPKYHRGNRQLLAILIMNLVLYVLVKVYHILRNKSRDKKWNAMTESERLEYLDTTKDEGNRRLDFRFAH
ncbi:major facilitator superfamily transporter [Fusarium subglutinans]|uniref:Major facilitator superfamily transporter n=1 Tax=Gibberella subglutinans TaxID=42677 RepID=A0A8H5UQP9_GIBSU|nr:major facilitator superfamily transporter [Fusarium subglutinans]KAF5594049.1 major facilitator superfamily transporter [Fusarium subglutinans]